MDESVVEACRAAVRRRFPGKAGASFKTHRDGWDCLVLEAQGVMFKFPRHAAAEERLAAEGRTLAFAAPYAARPIPRLTLIEDAALAAAGGPSVFSAHAAIAGPILTTQHYLQMNEDARTALCQDICATYLAFHRAGPGAALSAGVPRAPQWPDSATLYRSAAQSCDAPQLELAQRVLARRDAAGEDVTVFGHFDTHGWNMALDASGHRLAGLFDFGHAGVGPLHRDLSYPAFVCADCALRVARMYADAAGRAVDSGRILNTHAVLRLVELHDAGSAEERAERTAAFGAVMDDMAATLPGWDAGQRPVHLP